jgi:actin-related protein 9
MFFRDKTGEYEPYRVTETRRELKNKDAGTNGTIGANGSEDVEMREEEKEGGGTNTKIQATTQEGQEKNNGPTPGMGVTDRSERSSTGAHAYGSTDGESKPVKVQEKEQDSVAESELEPTEEIVLEEDIMSDEGAIYPIRDGRIVDWQCFFALLTHIYNTLSPPFHTPILLISEPVWSARDRETLTQFIFEKFKTPAFCLLDSALAACYAYGTSTATVIDVGHGKADVTAVTDFLVQEHGRGIALEGCGGEAMTDRLEELLSPKGFTREMCEQLKRSNITEILGAGTPLPGSAMTESTISSTSAASTGVTDKAPFSSAVPRGLGVAPQTRTGESTENGEGEDEGVLDVATIISGNTSEFLAKREKEKQEKAASKKSSGIDQSGKAVRLPNSKREKATFQFEEFVKKEPVDNAKETTSVRYVRQRREIEVGIERFLLPSPLEKSGSERVSNGILEDLAAQVHHTIISVPDAAKRSELWDSLIVLGNGSRIRGNLTPSDFPKTFFYIRYFELILSSQSYADSENRLHTSSPLRHYSKVHALPVGVNLHIRTSVQPIYASCYGWN